MTKALSMKKLTQFLMDWSSDRLKKDGEMKKIEKDTRTVLSFFDYVWKHRND